MPPVIKILLLENSEADITSIRRALQKAKINFEVKTVDNKASYIIELSNYRPDIILSNHRLKDMDAGQALELRNAKKYKVPFILVTDKTDELFAVKMMKLGAQDYLLKEDISKLAQTIKLALEQTKIISNDKKHENEILQKSLARNTAFLNAIPDLIFVTDRSGVINDFQASREMDPFVSPEQFLGKNCTEVLPPNVAAEIIKNIGIILAGGTLPVHEYQLPYPDGIHDFECRYAAINENEVLAIIRDITQHKQTQQKIIKSNRLYYFISQINQMIVYAADEKTLFKEACKIAVKIGKFRMAWIGLLNKETLDIEPFIFDGAELGYLSEIKVKADPSVAVGRGPSGMAIKHGKTITCNDIETDPIMGPWKISALKRNYQSNIGLPIKKFGKVVGTFTLYADTKRFFDDEEIALLEQTTENISFALEILEKAAIQKKAEEELVRSKKLFQNLVENIPGVYWVKNLDTSETVYISPSYETIWGRKCEEHYLYPASFKDSLHPDDKELFFEAYKNIAITLKTGVTYRITRPDGVIRWISERANVVIGSDGAKLEYGYAEDITESKMVENELADSEARLKTILQNEPECVKLMDDEGCLLDMNPAGLAMIEADNFEMVKGAKVINIINEPYRAAYTQLVEDVFKGNDVRMEFTITGLKGTQRWLETHAVPFRNAEQKIISLLAVTRDITKRKMAEENEKQVTQKLLKGAEIAHFGFLDWNFVTNEMTLSQQANNIFGLKEDLLIPATFMRDVIHPEDATLIHEHLQLAKEGLKDYNLDHRIVWPDDSIRWVNTKAELYRDETGNPIRLFGTILDITDQKNAELQIKSYNEQLRLLTTHLQNIREEERTRIAREIHDELGQQLTAIKMDVAWIHKNLMNKKETVSAKLKNIIELLDGSNQSVRKILSELRPATLDTYGLPEAMEWHIKQFTASTHIPVEITISEPELKLHEDIATNIFRIFQESLTNIMRYAQAKKVLILLNVIHHTITMTIEDDGIGFDTSVVQNKKTFGILGMRERVSSLNGKFEINSTPGKGTKISISLPREK
jgi:PAS domain S-box-containing protein